MVQACSQTWIYSSCYGFLGFQEQFKLAARNGYTSAAMVFQDYNSSSLPLDMDIQQLLWFPRITRMVQAFSQTWIYCSCYGFLGLQQFKLAAKHGYTAAAMFSQDFKNGSSLQLDMDIQQLLWFHRIKRMVQVAARHGYTAAAMVSQYYDGSSLPLDMDLQQPLWFSRITMVQACSQTWIYSSCHGFLGFQEWFKLAARHGYTAAAMVSQDFKNGSSLQLGMDIHQLLWFLGLQQFKLAVRHGYTAAAMVSQDYKNGSSMPLDMDIQQLLWFPRFTIVQACRQTWIYSSLYGYLGLQWFKLAARHGYTAAAMVFQDYDGLSCRQSWLQSSCYGFLG